MAGSCVFTKEYSAKFKHAIKAKWAWTADASGDVSGVGISSKLSGEIVGVHFIPGTGGDAPDDDYDVTILDPNGVDVLIGAGTDCKQSITVTSNYRIPLTTTTLKKLVLMDETLTPVVASAGAANTGVIELLLKTG